jgi:hypothetical protein
MKFRDLTRCSDIPLQNQLMMAFGLVLLSVGIAAKSLDLPLVPSDSLIGLFMGIGIGFELLALIRFSRRPF